MTTCGGYTRAERPAEVFPGGDVESEVADIWWQLYLIDENDNPVVPTGGLIESVLETDPTGMEMRPPEYFRNLDTRDPPG